MVGFSLSMETRMAQSGVASIPDDLSGAAILDAWRSALDKVGLQIESRKAPVETITVGHIARVA